MTTVGFFGHRKEAYTFPKSLSRIFLIFFLTSPHQFNYPACVATVVSEPKLTADQNRRLDATIQSISDLMGDNTDDLVEWLIHLLTGKADQLKEESMGRKKKPQPAASQPAPSAVTVPQDRTQLITEWKAASEQLTELKAKEHALRQALVSSMFDSTKLEGTESVDVGWGYQLRVTKDMAYNGTDENGEITALLDLLQARDATLADTLVRWKPDIAKKTYREVFSLATQHNDAFVLEALHKAITLKPGMPQLEMVPPKTDEPVAVAQPSVFQLENVPA
jgi:hypothetical protein